jgi:high-affinity K+ transport system ATPase subunit B
MLRRIPVFQQGAVCLTKFGPESGETADEILARKDLERRSGTRAHKNEFWWGIGEKGAAQSINRLISQHGANVVLFCAIKTQQLPKQGSTSDILVWRKYRILGSSTLHDIPKHVLITSAAVTKSGEFVGRISR